MIQTKLSLYLPETCNVHSAHQDTQAVHAQCGLHALHTFRASACFARASRQGATPPTNTAAEMAMQRWPAAPNAAPINALTAASGSASGMMTAWFLAPARRSW